MWILQHVHTRAYTHTPVLQDAEHGPQLLQGDSWQFCGQGSVLHGIVDCRGEHTAPLLAGNTILRVWFMTPPPHGSEQTPVGVQAVNVHWLGQSSVLHWPDCVNGMSHSPLGPASRM